MRDCSCRIQGNVCAVAMLAIVLSSLAAVADDQAKSASKCTGKKVQVSVSAQAAHAATSQWAIPEYWVLTMPQYEKAIGLTVEQKTELKKIGKQYREAVQAAYANLREAKPEQRAELVKDAQAKAAEAGTKVKEEVKKVLTDEQVAKCEELQFRVQAGGLLRSPQVQEKLELTEEQQDELEKVFAKHKEFVQKRAERQRKLQQAANEKALEVLTEEQLEKAKEALLKTYGAMMLRHPSRAGSPIELTEEQRERIDEIFASVVEKGQAWGAKARNAHRKATDKAIEILTPEQIEKLKDIRQNWGTKRDQGAQSTS